MKCKHLRKVETSPKGTICLSCNKELTTWDMEVRQQEFDKLEKAKEKTPDQKVKDYLERAVEIQKKWSSTRDFKIHVEIAKMIQREEHGTITN